MATKELTVMYRTDKSGPWHRSNIKFPILEFILSGNKDEFIKGLVELNNLGVDIKSISYRYTLEEAKKSINYK